MALFLKLALWNANGLAQHCQEVATFLKQHNIDIMLISESRFTNLNYFKIPNYVIYTTNHPDGTAHAGTAILIKVTIKHHEMPKYQTEHIQATNI